MMIDVDEYVQTIGRFLMSKSYKLVRSMDRNFIYQHLSVLSAAKQRQRQQQQQQSLPMADHALQQQPALPARGNAISSGEKPDATMAIRKGQDVSINNGGNGGKMPITPSAITTTTVAATTTTTTSTPVSSTNGGNLGMSSERFDKLMLLRGGDSESFDGVDSELSVNSADSSAPEEASDSDDVIEQDQQDQQQSDKEAYVDLEQPAMTQPLEEMEDGSVRVAGSPPPPMVTSLK
uniref:Uncharacterized protein n=1 Tax=Anopheles maculatus TaxID=74869 RepID=A0A182SDP8_9DIPT